MGFQTINMVMWMRAQSKVESSMRLTSSPPCLWNAILRNKSTIAKCRKFKANYVMEQTRKGSKPSQNIFNSIPLPTEIDPLTSRILITQSLNMSITIWHLQWKKLYMFDKLQEWRINCPRKCVLCSNEDETIEHLFIKCSFTREL